MGFRTQAEVNKLTAPEGKADAYFWDDEQPGLSVRLKGKARSWVVWYQVNGKRRKWTLGAAAGLPLKEGRASEPGRIVADAKEGKDPRDDRAKAKAKAADTLGALVKI